MALVELIAENGVFYPTVLLFGRFLPKKEKESKGQEPFAQMAAVETLDSILRLALFLACSWFPAQKDVLTGVGSLALDIVFLIANGRSHQLLEIVRRGRGVLQQYYSVLFDNSILRLGLAIS